MQSEGQRTVPKRLGTKECKSGIAALLKQTATNMMKRRAGRAQRPEISEETGHSRVAEEEEEARTAATAWRRLQKCSVLQCGRETIARI